MSFTGLGQPNGLSTLDSSGNVPANQLGNAVSGLALMSGLPNLLNPSNQSFIRNSFAYDDNLNQYGINVLRTKRGKFGQGAFIEESTTNLVYNSDFETVTGTATVFNDALTSYSGSTIPAPWTLGTGAVSFNASGMTVTSSAFLYAGNPNWAPIQGAGGQSLLLTAQATFTTPSSLTGGFINVSLVPTPNPSINGRLYAEVNLQTNIFYIAKESSGNQAVISSSQTPSQSIVTNTTYTITISIDYQGNVTGKLYLGSNTGGTLLATATVVDTTWLPNKSWLIGLYGTPNVVITNAKVTAPFPDGWTIGGDTRVAWGLTTNAISGSYSMSAVGVSGYEGIMYINGDIAMSASTPYTISGSINTVNLGNNGAFLRIDYKDSSGIIISQGTTTITGTTSTQRYSGTFTSPSTTTRGNIILDIKDSGTVVFDAFQIEQKPYATTYIRNDSTTATATRNADVLSYTLDQPLPSRWFGALVWTPQLSSSQLALDPNDPTLLWITDANGNWLYDLQFSKDVGKFLFQQNGCQALSPVVSFNAGDKIFLAVLCDPASSTLKLWVSINGGPFVITAVTNATVVNTAQRIYVGCRNTTRFECDGTIDFPIISTTIPTDIQLRALYQASEWGGLRNYPSNPSKLTVPNEPRSVIGTFLNETNDMGVISDIRPTIIGSGVSFWFKHNNYNEQGSDRFYNSSGQAFQIASWPGRPRIRYNTNTPVKGVPISWSNFYDIVQALSGGYKIQSGFASISLTANTEGSVNITFPVAFTNPPLVLVSMSNQSGVTSYSQRWSPPTVNGFTLYAICNLTTTLSAYWIAIGT